MSSPSLAQVLAQRTARGYLFKVLPDERVQCVACNHRCVLKDGQVGVCKVRFNEGGWLRVPFGYVAALQADPIEKKPFFHVLPGAKALSFGMLGCNFHCDFCQNWLGSQTLRDPAARQLDTALTDIRPAEVVRIALDQGCPVITSTYNEPTVTAEWAAEIFRIAKGKGLLTSFVSNGFMSGECLDFLAPMLDLCKVDLKCFRDGTYQKVMGGSLRGVQGTLEGLLEKGVWTEVVTLVVPGLNDSEEELTEMAAYLASLSKDLPWHVTAFHPDYRREDTPPTGGDQLLRAWQIGKAAGLRYVYTGNRPVGSGGTEDTKCPSCDKTLIERSGYRVTSLLKSDGLCPDCHRSIPGRWSRTPR